MTWRIGSFSAVAACAFATGCGAGGYGTSPGDSYSLATIPSPGTANVAVRSMAQLIPLPATTGYNGTIALPAASFGVDGSVAIYSGIAPQTQTVVPVLAPTQVGTSAAPIPLVYLTFTPTSNTTLLTYPGFTINLPADVPSTFVFYLGYFDPANAAAGYALATEGPASVAGSTLSFTPPPAIRAHWQARSSYAFVLYALPTPTPAASPTGSFTR